MPRLPSPATVKVSRRLQFVLVGVAMTALLLVGACVWRQAMPPWTGTVPHPVPVRFLLTFDDGPSGAVRDNPTASILGQLADNPIQPRIKALFFVQTRNPGGGASTVGRELLRRLHAEGHVLGLHSGSTRGHIKHVNLSPAELDDSLRDGAEDVRAVSGAALEFIRPPNWAFDDAVLAAYRKYQLRMLLNDVRARDGKHWGFKWNPRLHGHIHAELAAAAERVRAGELPTLDGAIPLVVTLHDLNTATARNLLEYMQALMDGARAAGLQVALKPFFDTRAEVEQVARLRAEEPLIKSEVPLAQGSANAPRTHKVFEGRSKTPLYYRAHFSFCVSEQAMDGLVQTFPKASPP